MPGERHPADAAATTLFEQAKKTAPQVVATKFLPELERLSRMAIDQLHSAWLQGEKGSAGQAGHDARVNG